MWKNVERFLVEELVPLCTAASGAREWLDGLADAPDGQLLGTCIAIDIVSGAIERATYAGIIDLLKPSAADCRLRFAEIVNAGSGGAFVMKSRFRGTELTTDDSYVRFMELGAFVQYQAKLPLTPRNIKRVREQFFAAEKSVLIDEMRGRLTNCFVASWNEIEQHLVGSEGNKATALVDVLGLQYFQGVGVNGQPEMIGLRYPAEINLEFRQPTALDVWWVHIGCHFSSFGKIDNWGRTCTLQTGQSGSRERVHNHYRGAERFQTSAWGTVDSMPVRNHSALLNEAFRRFQSLVDRVEVPRS